MGYHLGPQAISTPVTPLHLTFTPITGLLLAWNSPVLSQPGEIGNYWVSEVKLLPNLLSNYKNPQGNTQASSTTLYSLIIHNLLL